MKKFRASKVDIVWWYLAPLGGYCRHLPGGAGCLFLGNRYRHHPTSLKSACQVGLKMANKFIVVYDDDHPSNDL
jgi:hypothetical protein